MQQQAFPMPQQPSSMPQQAFQMQPQLLSIQQPKLWTAEQAIHTPGATRASSSRSSGDPDATLIDDPVTAITRLQAFDGSFELNDTLCKLVFGDKFTLDGLKNGISASLRSHTEAEKIWATAISVAYLKMKASEKMDVWVGLWEKASGYTEQALAGSAVSFDQVVADAVQML